MSHAGDHSMFEKGKWTSWVVGWVCATLCALALAACSGQSSVEGEVGRIDATLVTQTPNGTTYRLENVTVTVTGPTSTSLVSDDSDPAETELTTELPVGSYTATLEPGWSLVRLSETGSTGVPATLLSPNPIAVTIHAGEVTRVTLRFETSGGVIEFEPGALQVDVEVVETTPALPLLTTAPVSLPGNVLDVAAGPNRAYVLAGSTVVGLTPTGDTLFQWPVPTGTPRAVLADGETAVVVATSTSTLHVTRLDGTTGSAIETVNFPTASTIMASSEVCATVDPAGRIVVATNENGNEVRTRSFDGSNLFYMATVTGAFAQPMRCDLVAKPEGRTFLGVRTTTQRIQLTRLEPTGLPTLLGSVGSGVSGGFQLADGGSPDGLFVASGVPGGLRLSLTEGSGETVLAELGPAPGAVNDLISGTFAGQSGLSVLVAGQLGGAFVGTFAPDGSALSENRESGSSVLAADAGDGLVWALVQEGSQTLLRLYPE